MAVPTWPAGLPQYFIVRGYAEGLPDNVLRSESDIGPAKTRRRSSAAPWPVSGTILATQAQYETFRAFVANDLAAGALPFNLPNQRATSGTWLVRLTEAVDVSFAAPYYEIALSLEVLP